MMQGDPEVSLIYFVASEFGMRLMQNNVYRFR
jgi:hypothetical protein